MASGAGNIAVIHGADTASVQTLFADTVKELRARGVRVAGVIAHGNGPPERTCTAGYMRDIASGDQFQIYLDDAPTDTMCDLDANGVDAACNTIISQIDECDLVVLSKFGKLEAAQNGLFPALAAAIAAGRPVVTMVSPKHREALQKLLPDAACIAADRAELMGWLARQV